MTEIEIVYKMHLGRGSWFEARPPFIGCYRSRPFVTNGCIMLIGDTMPALDGADNAHPNMFSAISDFISAKRNDDQPRGFRFSGVPEGSLPCVSCLASGAHNRCCLDGIAECSCEVCDTCFGDGEVFPSGIWTVQTSDGYVLDAYYLRLALGFLQTDKPVFSCRGKHEPVILSFLGRDAIVMPMKGHLRDGASRVSMTEIA